jgi:peptidoglycan L-alanyl-D-glutamate endopeptidase CwlK
MIKRDLKRLRGVTPRLIVVLYEAQKRSPYKFHVGRFGGRRTSQEQNMLFKRKSSKKDGYIKLSKHQSGKAVDFVIFVNGQPIWTKDEYESVARLMQDISMELFGLSLRWGGDWDQDGVRVDKDPDESFFDGGHVEI